MATADKLNYLSETKNQIKKVIEEENLVTIDDTTTFREYADKIKSTNEEIKKYIPTDSQNGTNLQVTNAVPLNAKSLVVDGNNYQYTTSGKNKFNVTDYNNIFLSTNSGATTNKNIDNFNVITSENDYSGVFIAIENLKNYVDNYENTKKYIVSFDVSSTEEINFYFGAGTKSTIVINSTKQRVSIETTIASGLVFYSRSKIADVTINISKIMVSENDSEYETYTGGVASPNPNYPQEIEVIDNLKLTNSGKNICPTDYENYWEKGHYNVNGVKTAYQSRCRLVNLLKIKPNTKYYCNLSETRYQFTIREFDINGVFLKDKGLIGQHDHLYTSSSDAYFIGLSIAFDNTSEDVDYSSLLGDIKPFICLYSETNKEFELYRETNEYLIDLKDNFLAKINNIKDTLDLTSGILNKNIKKIVLDGSEDEKWNMDALQTGCSLRSFYTNIKKEEAKPMTKPLANYLGYNNDIYFNDNIGIDVNWNSAIRIKIGANVATLEDLISYLANNPLIVYYQVAETETIQIDPTNIKMYEGTNNIELDTNLETNMSLEYYKDYRLDTNVIEEVEVSEE